MMQRSLKSTTGWLLS